MNCILFLIAISVSCACWAQDFTIVFLNKKVDKAELPEEELKKLMDGHLANMARLAKEGKLWAAGPFDGGGGIFIFNSGVLDDVKEWIKTDPGIAAKRWDIEVFPFTPRIGSVCAVGEQYVMTNYSFVRYVPAKTSNAAVERNHQLHIQSWPGEAVIAEASLGEGKGSVLVLGAESVDEQVAKDPTVEDGYFTANVKKLYIAKGSFCEAK